MNAENQPLVYIIVLNWNGKEDTRECLNSLASLSYSNYRVLVVDNGSVDGSVAYLRERFPAVVFIENATNLGYVNGNNQAFDYALQNGAQYVFLLNNDTVVSADVLTSLIDVAEDGREIAAVGPKICYYDNPDRIWCLGGRILFWLGCTIHIAARRRDTDAYRGIRDADYLTGCALLMKRHVIEEVGRFDPVFNPGYFEDTDLCVRIRRKGYELVCVGHAKILHKVSRSSGGGSSALKTYLKTRNGVIFFHRYARPVHWLTMPVAMAASAMLTSLIGLLHGKPEIARAVYVGCRDLFTRRARNGRFQPSSRCSDYCVLDESRANVRP